MRATALVFSTLSIALLSAVGTAASASEARPDRIKVAYVPPTDAAQQPVYELMKQRHTLEKVQQIFSPFRLPVDLTVKTMSCGMVNAYYRRQDRDAVVTICYEYMENILKNMPKETTLAGITQTDAVVGQFFYVVAHEMGHAMFDLLDVPVFGRPEDAADQFAAYIMLQFGKDQARSLITGAAYSYKNFIEKPSLTIPLQAFSDAHGASAQRFYNLVCMAYGADPRLFADVVEKGFLPEQRARLCNWEYREVAYAFKQLIRPHLDLQLAKRVLSTDWLPEEAPPPRPR
jgi:hypothetical protein